MPRPVTGCAVGRLWADYSLPQRERLLDMLEDVDTWSAPQLARALAVRTGRPITRQIVMQHRLGYCSCERAGLAQRQDVP